MEGVDQNNPIESTNECLGHDQNIMDQEPFSSIILSVIPEDTYQRENKIIAIRNSMINTAAQRLDICRRLQEVEPNERKKLFWGGEDFGTTGRAPLHISKLRKGLPVGVNLMSVYDYDLFYLPVLIKLADFPGWDMYLRQYKNLDFIKATGEQRQNKIKGEKIPTFNTWLKNTH